MAIFRGWFCRCVSSVAVHIFLPLTFELFRRAFLLLTRRVDLVFAIVIVGQGRVDLSQIELRKLFLDSLDSIATMEVKHDVFDRYTRCLGARFSTSDLRFRRDV